MIDSWTGWVADRPVQEHEDEVMMATLAKTSLWGPRREADTHASDEKFPLKEIAKWLGGQQCSAPGAWRLEVRWGVGKNGLPL